MIKIFEKIEKIDDGVGREERVALEALELLKKCQPNYPEGQ